MTKEKKKIATNQRTGRIYYEGDIVQMYDEIAEVKTSDGSQTYLVKLENIKFL